MKKYRVRIKETMYRTVIVIAQNVDMAEEFANDPDQWMWDRTEDTDFDILEVEELEKEEL